MPPPGRRPPASAFVQIGNRSIFFKTSYSARGKAPNMRSPQSEGRPVRRAERGVRGTRHGARSTASADTDGPGSHRSGSAAGPTPTRSPDVSSATQEQCSLETRAAGSSASSARPHCPLVTFNSPPLFGISALSSLWVLSHRDLTSRGLLQSRRCHCTVAPRLRKRPPWTMLGLVLHV